MPDRAGPSHAQRCLVTGGAGFIGSHLADHLLSLGHSVTVVDNLSTGRRENLDTARRGHADRLVFLHADLSEALRGPLAGARFDQVFHLAAAVGVKRIIERPIESIETNVLDTAALLHYAADHGPAPGTPAPTLIASSSEVYGKSSKPVFSESDDCVYGPTTAWRWSYAAGKAVDEYLALAWHAQRGLPTVIVRLFNTVGPRQVGDYGMVLPAFVGAAVNSQPLKVYGDGSQTRCFCDVRDIVPALPKLLGTPAALGKVVNLGGDRPISIIELARTVIRTLRSSSTIEPIPYDRAYGPGFEDLLRRRPDLSRAASLIGFAPRITLEETILAVAEALESEARHNHQERAAAP